MLRVSATDFRASKKASRKFAIIFEGKIPKDFHQGGNEFGHQGHSFAVEACWRVSATEFVKKNLYIFKD